MSGKDKLPVEVGATKFEEEDVDISAKIAPGGVVTTASAALAVREGNPAVMSGTEVGPPPGKFKHKLGRGIVKIVVTIGGEPPTATKLNVTTDIAKAPMFTSSNSVIKRSHCSVLEMVATYSITLAKTPSWKSKPVPNNSTVVPA